MVVMLSLERNISLCRSMILLRRVPSTSAEPILGVLPDPVRLRLNCVVGICFAELPPLAACILADRAELDPAAWGVVSSGGGAAKTP